MTSPPHLDLIIVPEDLEVGAANVLRSLRPHWNLDHVKFKLFTDGITNKLIGCFNSTDGSDVVLVRVYGPNTDLLINRKAEMENIKLLQSVGFAPPLFATFNNGLAYKYIPGEVLTVDTVRSPTVYPHVAQRVAQLHLLRLHNHDGVPPAPALWVTLDKFIGLVPQQYSDPKNHQRYVSLVAGGAEQLRQECLNLKSELSELGSPLVFCHNDLLLGNVIHQSDSNSITFIDYEYAGYNYQAYDIGNHFAEFAGVSDVDFSRYPDEKLQRSWLQIYLTEYKGHQPSDTEITMLYQQVNKFALASHFLWGVWALVQVQHSNIDFDFVEYAALRLNEYFKLKETTLATNESR